METIASATYGEYEVIVLALLVLQEETKVKITREGTSDLWDLRGTNLEEERHHFLFFFTWCSKDSKRTNNERTKW